MTASTVSKVLCLFYRFKKNKLVLYAMLEREEVYRERERARDLTTEKIESERHIMTQNKRETVGKQFWTWQLDHRYRPI